VRQLNFIAVFVLFLAGVLATPAAAHTLPGGNVGSVYIMPGGASGGTVGAPSIVHTRVAKATGGGAPTHPLPASAIGVKVRCYREGGYAGQSTTYYNATGLLSVTKIKSCTTSVSGGYQSRGYLYTYRNTGYLLKTSWSSGHNF